MASGGGTNDTKILLVILSFLILTSFALTIIRPALRVGESISTPNITSIPLDRDQANLTTGVTSTWNIIIGIFLYFPGFPLWFNIIFIILRVILYWLIAKVLIRGAGG